MDGQTKEICGLPNVTSGPSVISTTEKKGVLFCTSTERPAHSKLAFFPITMP